MKTELNLNFRPLYQSVVLSLFIVGLLSGMAYLGHLGLSAVFSSPAVFFSLFGLAVGLGALGIYHYQAEPKHQPRISIRLPKPEVFNDDDS